MQTHVKIIQRITLIGTPSEVKNTDISKYRIVSQCPLFMHDGQIDVMQLVIERQIFPAVTQPLAGNDDGPPAKALLPAL